MDCIELERGFLMENTYSKRDIELEEIHYLAAGNIQFNELLQRFPHWDENELYKVFESVIWFCYGFTHIEQVFNIQGKDIYATFPYEPDEKAMLLVKDILSEQHAKHHINIANQ